MDVGPPTAPASATATSIVPTLSTAGEVVVEASLLFSLSFRCFLRVHNVNPVTA